jgi:ubiquinone/menaquinone biosynthesis C-methylase UbiE
VPHRRAKPRPEKKSTTDWSPVANWYDELVGESGSEYHREVVLPGVLRLLNPLPRQNILDVACGQGVLARMLAAKGADVTAVDASPELIEAARKRDASHFAANLPALPQAGEGGGEGLPKVTYRVADARDLNFLSPSYFDSAACVLAIQNIHPIQPVFAGVARALKPHGKFVVAMMHPHFRGPKETHWGWDEKQKIQYRRVDRYLIPRKSPIVAHPGHNSSEYTWTFHKPLEQYVRALRNAGLLVEALEEWPSHKTSTSGPRAAAENTARKEIPMFLALRVMKVPMVEPQT